LVTDVRTRLLRRDEALEIGRPRSQIELLFKLWKSQRRIGESSSAKPRRVLCELHVMQVALIIRHSVLLVSGWEHVDRSLVKMAQTVRKYVWELAKAVGRSDAIRRVISELRTILGSYCRANRRRKHPASRHQLLNLEREGLTRCEWISPSHLSVPRSPAGYGIRRRRRCPGEWAIDQPCRGDFKEQVAGLPGWRRRQARQHVSPMGPRLDARALARGGEADGHRRCLAAAGLAYAKECIQSEQAPR
jgi:hypothetical protein